jgi:drug/metabolite transporter (DMT)-like permease
MAKKNISSDKFGLALSYLLLGEFSGLALDISAKYILQEYSLIQFIFVRSLLATIIFLIICPWYGGLQSMKTKKWKWHLLRAFLSIIAMFGFFYGISRMPLVNAVTIVYIAPIIVTALSTTLLNEKVGWPRWIAVIAGFSGALIILRPGEGSNIEASLAVFASAIGFALLAITARKMAKTESIIAMSVYVLIGPMIASMFFLPNNYIAPDGSDWLIFLFAGVASVFTWIGYINAYKRYSPVSLAPFEYLALIGAAIAGYYLWNEVPDKFVLIGASIIIGSGIFIARREIGKSQSTSYIRGFRSSGVNNMIRRLKKK